MPRLLILSTISRTLSAFLLPFAEHFRAEGWHVAAGAGDLDHAPDHLRQAFDALHPIPWRRSIFAAQNYSAALTQLRNCVAGGSFDIVHVHTPIAAFLARFALRNRPASTRLVYTAHGFHFGYSARPPAFSPYFYLEKLAARWTDALIVINQRDHATARRHTLHGAGRLYHIPGIGVDLERYSAQSRTLEQRMLTRKSLGVGSDDALLLMIAEFNPGKRHADLLRALALVPLAPRVMAAFAGDGPGLEAARALAASLGLADRTLFLGFRPDIPELVHAADFTVLPSAREGLPRSVIESMALGTPVIGTRIRGIEELLADGAGLLVEVGRVDQLAQAIGRMANDPQLRKDSAARASVRVRDYDLKRVLEFHDQIYADLLQRPRTALQHS